MNHISVSAAAERGTQMYLVANMAIKLAPKIAAPCSLLVNI